MIPAIGGASDPELGFGYGRATRRESVARNVCIARSRGDHAPGQRVLRSPAGGRKSRRECPGSCQRLAPAVPAVPSPPTDVPASPQAFAQPFSEIPQSPAVPGSTGYVFDRISPLNATPSFPSLNDAFLFPGVPGAQAMPGIPGMPATTPGMPLTEVRPALDPCIAGKRSSICAGYSFGVVADDGFFSLLPRLR